MADRVGGTPSFTGDIGEAVGMRAGRAEMGLAYPERRRVFKEDEGWKRLKGRGILLSRKTRPRKGSLPGKETIAQGDSAE